MSEILRLYRLPFTCFFASFVYDFDIIANVQLFSLLCDMLSEFFIVYLGVLHDAAKEVSYSERGD